ncbi:hypothetical protein HOY82DRAFT_534735 [Tuber indicum]|nr:hypothetical protein HOY82DRAFT_534735 [Tuber indicum]
MFRYLRPQVLKMRIKYWHLYQVKTFNKSIFTTPYHNADIGNWDKSSFNLVTGHREGSTDNMQGEQVVFCNAEKLLTQLKIEVDFLDETIYRLEAVQHNRVVELYDITRKLEQLAQKVEDLENCPSERDKVLNTLKEKVLAQMDNRITTLKELEKAIRSSSENRVKELGKLEGQLKANSRRTIKKLRKLTEANPGTQAEKKVQVNYGDTKLVDELKASSDILVTQVSGFKNKVHDNLTKQICAICELRGDIELHSQRLISGKWDDEVDSE